MKILCRLDSNVAACLARVMRPGWEVVNVSSIPCLQAEARSGHYSVAVLDPLDETLREWAAVDSIPSFTSLYRSLAMPIVSSLNSDTFFL